MRFAVCEHIEYAVWRRRRAALPLRGPVVFVRLARVRGHPQRGDRDGCLVACGRPSALRGAALGRPSRDPRRLPDAAESSDELPVGRGSFFWWEPLEMCRKLTLVGWVLLIQDGSEQARVVVALLVSFTFLALRLSLKPMRRCAQQTCIRGSRRKDSGASIVRESLQLNAARPACPTGLRTLPWPRWPIRAWSSCTRACW
eukprot:2851854-Prymnesium_polylepis.1